jgi:putative PIN family toxin of toxin-antitoxin system
VRLVLDTNVLLAAFLTRGVCHELLEHCVTGHQLATSDFILSEFAGKLEGKFHVPPGKISRAVGMLRAEMALVELPQAVEHVCRDPDDDRVLATAVAGKCRCLVTGDADLLILREHGGVKVISPGSFWAFEAVVERT